MTSGRTKYSQIMKSGCALWKIFTLALLARVLIASSSQAASLQLGWQSNTEPNIAGYRLYKGVFSNVYNESFNCGNVLTYTVTGLADGTYYFALRAYNVLGFESQLSDELVVTVQTVIRINGQITYCLGGNLAGVNVTAHGSALVTAVTDANGNYSLLVPLGGNYVVDPSKSPVPPGTSIPIDTVDVIACQRHFLGFISLMGCRATAGDVNRDGRITTVDAVAIQRFLLGSAVGTANTGKYLFTPVNRNYSVPVIDQLGQDYSGLIYGDVVP